MLENNSIMIDDAKSKFSELLSSLDKSDVADFKTYVYEKLNNQFFQYKNNSQEESEENLAISTDVLDDPVSLINAIALEIKEMLPVEATLPSENITMPQIGENSDCLPDITISVDEFLYDEDDVDELAEQGKLKRNYCKDCGSKNTEPMIFISHSMSRDMLYYIFNTRLPKLDGKTVLDVGSRLGAILYSAFAYSDAKKIIGVEMNDEFCALQRKIIQGHGMQDRIEVVHERIEKVPELVQSCDVIVLNNAFEFYLPRPEQIFIWNFLKKNLKKGAIIVTRPPLETTFKHLDTGIEIEKWLKVFKGSENCNVIDDCLSVIDDRFCDIQFYEVL